MIRKLLVASALACISLLGATASAHPFDRLDHVSRPTEGGKEHARPERFNFARMARPERPSQERPTPVAAPSFLDKYRHHGDILDRSHRAGQRNSTFSRVENPNSVKSMLAHRLNSRMEQRGRCGEGACIGSSARVANKGRPDTAAGRINLPRTAQSYNGTGNTLHAERMKIKNRWLSGLISGKVAKYLRPGGGEIQASGLDNPAASGHQMVSGITSPRPMGVSSAHTIRGLVDNYQMTVSKQRARDTFQNHVEQRTQVDRSVK